MVRIEQAIILAGGEGQRLKPFTSLRPKVMLPIANKPILHYVIEALAQAGLRQIILVVGYRREEIQDFLMASDSIIGMEKECGEARRKTVQRILREDEGDKEFLVYFELARSIEASTNSLIRAAGIIHDNILESLRR